MGLTEQVLKVLDFSMQNLTETMCNLQ
jgi:hypothetical protein